MHVKFKGLKCGGRLCDIHSKCMFHCTFRISMQSASLFLGPLVVNEYKTSFLSNLGMIQKRDNISNSTSILSF